MDQTTRNSRWDREPKLNNNRRPVIARVTEDDITIFKLGYLDAIPAQSQSVAVSSDTVGNCVVPTTKAGASGGISRPPEEPT